MTAQDLEYRQSTVCTNEFACANTHLVDNHPEGVTIGLSCRPVVFRFGHPKPFRMQEFRTHPPTGPPTGE